MSEQQAPEQGPRDEARDGKAAARGKAFPSGKAGAKDKAGARSKAGGQKKGAAKPAESDSVWSGRLMTAIVLLLALVLVPVSYLGKLITKQSPESAPREQWKVGKTATVHITVTTADYDKLACADPRPLGPDRCGYVDERTRAPRPEGAPLDDNKKHELQPYRSSDDQLLLMAGLWAQPEVATRLHREPARSVAESRLSRFYVACELEFLEERDQAKVRWDRRGAWSNQGKAMVARPKSCSVLEQRAAR
jgi:hypothetical protein